MAKVLSVVAPEKFQQTEYLESKRALEEKGHEVFLCSTHQIAFDKNEEAYKVDALLDEVFEDDYDAILFVGGPGIQEHFDDPDFQSLARAFFENGKLTSAICAAPGVLAKAGLLEGKKATCWPGVGDILRSAGAEYTEKPVESDGLIVTGDGPDSAYAFGLKIAELLS